jgi:hypothetical protein
MRTNHTMWQKGRLFLEAAAWLTLMRIAISLAPFHRLSPLLGLAPGEDSLNPCKEGAESIGWAVRASAHRLPWHSTCLCRALAAAMMLRRIGIAGTLHLGVGKDLEGALSFHAWLRCNDVIVTGDEGRERHISMSTFRTRTFPNERKRL